MCYRWKQKISENALAEKSFIRKIILFDNYCRYKNVSCWHFYFSSYKYSADKTMKHFITFKFLFDLYLIKPQFKHLNYPSHEIMQCMSLLQLRVWYETMRKSYMQIVGFLFCYYPTEVKLENDILKIWYIISKFQTHFDFNRPNMIISTLLEK